jgi:hypothetical protein
MYRKTKLIGILINPWLFHCADIEHLIDIWVVSAGHCREMLANNTGPAILFCLCRVGNDESAARSLKELNTANGTKDLIFYGEDPIDNKL